jgi:hypothetical protein
VNIQALVAKRPVEAFDKVIICWLARATEVDLYVMVVRSKIHQPTRELAAVIDEQTYLHEVDYRHTNCFTRVDTSTMVNARILVPSCEVAVIVSIFDFRMS